jgi:hypothetical protein
VSFFRGFAAWLVANPWSAVLALGACLPVPPLQPIGGAILVMLVLAKGVRSAAIMASLAAAVLVIVSLILGGQAVGMATLMATTCIPLLALATILVASRSLTMTLQFAVLAATLGLLLFALLVEDTVAFWQPFWSVFSQMLRESNMQEQVALLEANPSMMARFLTPTVAIGFWINFTLSIVLGHFLFQRLPQNEGRYGRFGDLNFGRVMASALALASVLSYLTGAELMLNIALLLFAVFWVQGLALTHWLREQGKIQTVAVVAIYVSHIFLSVIIAIPLAIVGYLDAWFDWRRRIELKVH